ncbi:MAG: hypothetical protein C4530_17075 [Desulfobacteraceae bacterium]|nr:MAG: hypothetical protein C4530_17075 [Desulfobacteraceae bacterium]
MVRSPEKLKGNRFRWMKIIRPSCPPVCPVSPVLPENMGALQRIPLKKNALEIDFFGICKADSDDGFGDTIKLHTDLRRSAQICG